MKIEGASIYEEGVTIAGESEEKIRQIVNTLKTLSPSSKVSLRFVKSGRTVEGLLWGKASGVPIGAYNRGGNLRASTAQVLDKLYGRVRKQCMKIWKANRSQLTPRIKDQRKNQPYGQSPLAVAG